MTSDSSGPRIHIVATGVANTASVCAAFRRLGCVTEFVKTLEDIRSASLLVLPGVGAFAAAMTRLRSADQVDVLRQRIAAGRPTLAICLGMQLLGASSEESPGEPGLGIVDAVATRFDAAVRVPHMGWNRVVADPDCELLRTGDAYFANSYRWPAEAAAESAVTSWSVGRAVHGGPFLAAVERGPVLACQFHPELSGEYGAELLRRWLRRGEDS